MQNPNKLDRINYCEYSAFGDFFSLVASCSLSQDFRVFVITRDIAALSETHVFNWYKTVRSMSSIGNVTNGPHMA